MSEKNITAIKINQTVDITKRVRQIAAELGCEPPSHYLSIPLGLLAIELKRIASLNECMIKSWTALDGTGYTEIVLPDLKIIGSFVLPTETEAIVFTFKWLADNQYLRRV